MRDILTSESVNPYLLEAREFVLDSPFITTTANLRAYALPSFVPGRSILHATNDLMNRVFMVNLFMIRTLLSDCHPMKF
ncbi:MAG: hypothetical protein R3E08_03905 [Thiotrichaceae bacterium]